MRDVRTKRLQHWEEHTPSRQNERRRIEKLRDLELLSPRVEEEFSEFVALAVAMTGCRYALFTLVTSDVVLIKSGYQTETQQFARDISFCTHTIEQNDVFFIPDASVDPHFSQHALYLDESKVRFYAGVPIKSAGGIPLGTLCVLDSEPKELDSMAIRGLFVLGNMLERRLRERERSMNEITGTFTAPNLTLANVTSEKSPPRRDPFSRTGQRSVLSHQTRNIFACIQCNCEYLFERFREDEEVKEVLTDIREAVNDLTALIDNADHETSSGRHEPLEEDGSLEHDFDSEPLTEGTLAEPTEPFEEDLDSEPELLTYEHLKALRSNLSDA